MYIISTSADLTTVFHGRSLWDSANIILHVHIMIFQSIPSNAAQNGNVITLCYLLPSIQNFKDLFQAMGRAWPATKLVKVDQRLT